MRLTHKKEDWYWKDEEFWLSAENPSLEKADEIYYKLAEFEDFMEEQGVESLRELKKALGRQFEIREAPFRYGQEINGVFFSNEQIMVLNQFAEFNKNWLEKYKNSEQENQALKARWEKLKEFIEEHLQYDKEELSTEKNLPNRFYITAEKMILEKMQELEEE